MVGNVENYKVKVNNWNESKQIQDLFFELRCEWATCGNNYNDMINIGDYIFLTDCNMLNYGLGIGKKEITLQYLKHLVVLKRNSIDDATHYYGGSKYYLTDSEFYQYSGNKWVNIDECVNGVTFKKIDKDGEVKMKEYLELQEDGSYLLWSALPTANYIDGWIEVPEGADIYTEHSVDNDLFYKHQSGDYLYYFEDSVWSRTCYSSKNYGKEMLELGRKVVWQRNLTTPNTLIQDKLKFIEKWLNGEKIQYILGIESDKSQWHNFTEGAMQYTKRPDIKFREAPKYVTINGIEFKNIESILNYIKSNFDLEDGGKSNEF